MHCRICCLLQLWDALNSKQQTAAFGLLPSSSKEPWHSLTGRSSPGHLHTESSVLAHEESWGHVQLLPDGLGSCRGDSGELQLSEMGQSLRGNSIDSMASLTRLDSIKAAPEDCMQPTCFTEQLADCFQPLQQHQQDGTIGSPIACVSHRSSRTPETAVADAACTDAYQHASPIHIHEGSQDNSPLGSFSLSKSLAKTRVSGAAAARALAGSRGPVHHAKGLGWVWWDWRPHDLSFLAGFVQVRAGTWFVVSSCHIRHASRSLLFKRSAGMLWRPPAFGGCCVDCKLRDGQ
jgi:hypothetical protein